MVVTRLVTLGGNSGDCENVFTLAEFAQVLIGNGRGESFKDGVCKVVNFNHVFRFKNRVVVVSSLH